MPFTEMLPTDRKKGETRLQIMGPPYTFKTTIAATFEPPVTILQCPGEKHTDILTPSDKVRVLLNSAPDYSIADFDWVKLWTDFVKQTDDLVGTTKGGPGVYGPLKTLVFDGTHKAYQICRRAGAEKFADGRKAWGWTADEFLGWFSRAYYSPHVEWVVWLLWSAKEAVDDAGKKKSRFPDYMGQFQQTCVGESNIIYQYIEGGEAYWQLRQTDEVMGIGLRVPLARAASIPLRIKASWPKLKAILQPTDGGR